MTKPNQDTPAAVPAELAELTRKLAIGAAHLAAIHEQGVEIATTLKDEVFRQDKTVLYKYRPLAEEQSLEVPVLIVYGLIGRYTMSDLQEDRSLVRSLLARGIDVYTVDWGNPSRADRWLTLEDYISGYARDCVAAISAREGVAKVNILGICEGGAFSVCYAALYPETVQNLVVTVTPVDFHADLQSPRPGHGTLNRWARSLDADDVDLMIEAFGNMPGELMGAVFGMITPLRTLTKYNVDLWDMAEDPQQLLRFLRMEKWLSDRPHHAGEAARQWFKDFYQNNKLIANEVELGGRTVDLRNITMPVLNVFALDDHIIPPECSRALGAAVGTSDYTEMPLPGGHIGVFVSGRFQGVVGAGISDWLQQRDARAMS